MKVKVVCAECGIEFEKINAEFQRSKERGRRHYCSRACCGKGNCKHLTKYNGLFSGNLLKGSAKDEFSEFKTHIRRCNRRDREVNITLSDLKDQWDKQNGICPITGWVLDHNLTGTHSYKQPSLDRIDSTKGYVVGNIQFVALIAQYAKHQFHEDALIDFCKAVTQHRG